jgi:DNA-binding IscR family transcriptional regulator
MFRLNKLTDYGIVLMTHIAHSPDDSLHTARELAAGTDLALATVGKVLRGLLDHHLVTSHRGMKGGYALARPAPLIRRAVIPKYFNAAGSEGRSGNSQWQTSPAGIGLSAMSPRDREVPKGSGGSKTAGAF